MDRRQLLTVLALGSLTACARRSAPAYRQPVALAVATEPPPAVAATTGPPRLVSALPEAARLADQVALTIDDGFSGETVAAYVEFAHASGIHLTFNPNGMYAPVWDEHADVLRPLIEAGQVQIGNHTYSHKDVKRLSDRGIEEELQRNEDWIADTFATTTRPWFRPPFGFRDERTDAVVAGLGWTNVLLWNGSFGDSAVLSQRVLMTQARKWLHAGTIMLGHANHPTVTHVYPQLLELLTERGLTAKTLNEAFRI